MGLHRTKFIEGGNLAKNLQFSKCSAHSKNKESDLLSEKEISTQRIYV